MYLIDCVLRCDVPQGLLRMFECWWFNFGVNDFFWCKMWLLLALVLSNCCIALVSSSGWVICHLMFLTTHVWNVVCSMWIVSFVLRCPSGTPVEMLIVQCARQCFIIYWPIAFCAAMFLRDSCFEMLIVQCWFVDRFVFYSFVVMPSAILLCVLRLDLQQLFHFHCSNGQCNCFTSIASTEC